MANAETYKNGTPNFFPLQGPRVLRGDDVRTPTDAANVDYPPSANALTKSDEDAVWAEYEAMPAATETMERASNVGHSRKWLVPGIIAASFIVGIAYAALNDRPSQISEPTLASQQGQATDTSTTALMGGSASQTTSGPTVTTQSAFDSSAPVAASPAPTAKSGASSANGAVERAQQPAAKPAKSPPPIVEQAPPAPTYSRGQAPATALPTPTPAPNAGTIASPTPLPSAPDQEPALRMDLAPPSETVPAPGSVPENAQTPQ